MKIYVQSTQTENSFSPYLEGFPNSALHPAPPVSSQQRLSRHLGLFYLEDMGKSLCRAGRNHWLQFYSSCYTLLLNDGIILLASKTIGKTISNANTLAYQNCRFSSLSRISESFRLATVTKPTTL